MRRDGGEERVSYFGRNWSAVLPKFILCRCVEEKKTVDNLAVIDTSWFMREANFGPIGQ